MILLCPALERGATINGACALAGISPRSFRDWRERGETGEKPYARFLSAVTRAREIAKHAILGSILADKDWRARAWYLEKCFPNEFGLRPLPNENDECKKEIGVKVILNTNGKTMGELLDFPTDGDLSLPPNRFLRKAGTKEIV